jgi:uncharacterized protein
MFFDTIFEGTSVGVSASLAFSAVVPGIISAADTIAGPGPIPEAIVAGRPEVSAGVRVECHERSGVVEIHDPRLFRPGREAFCRALAQSAIESLQARRVEICLIASTCRLEFPPGEFDRAELGRRVADAVSAAIPMSRDRPGEPHDAPPGWTSLTAVATSIGERQEDHPGAVVRLDHATTPTNQPAEAPEAPSRLVELALTGGSLTMVVVGAILPGIPTLPFLVMATRHAVRLSPWMDRFLRRRTWCAALLDNAEASGGLLNLDRRAFLKLLPIIVLAAAVLVIVHPPMPVVMVLEIALMAFIGFREMRRLGGREVALGVPA